MNKDNLQLKIELFILFIILPLLLTTSILPLLKISLIILGIIYVFHLLIKNKQLSKSSLLNLNTKKHWPQIIIQFCLMIVISTIIMYYQNPENLFIVVRKNVGMWIGFTIIYSFFSVYPQELVYRTFFFYRYQKLFYNSKVLIIVNAFLFSFAHIILKNWLVLLLTLIGGVIFATTYNKSKSIMLTSIEHAFYGSWLFTLGMGEMLAFPPIQ